jgi:hypothetical protein
MKSLLPQWRAHGNRDLGAAVRTSNPPARSPRRGWRPLVAAAFTAGLLALTATAAFAQGVWQTLPSTPTARVNLAAATAPCPAARHRTCVYAIGGSIGALSYVNTVEAYSPAANTWATLPPMPTARSSLAGAAAPCPRVRHRTCVYAIGGYDLASIALNTVEAYSPATNTWATLPPMPTARRDLAAATAPCPGARHRTCVYAIGGSTNGGTLAVNTVEAYSPATNSWATLPSLPTARPNMTAATAPCPGARNRTCVYAIGGSTNGGTLAVNTVEAYSPATNSWATLPPMPTARSYLAGAAAPCPGARNRTCVYAIGGSTNGATSAVNTVEAYSPATNTWATLPSMPTARSYLAGAAAPCPATRNHACVYAIDGYTGNRTVNTVEAFAVGR